jgi:hypothetical protein
MTIKGKNETTMEHVKLIYYDPHKILELYNKDSRMEMKATVYFALYNILGEFIESYECMDKILIIVLF